MTAPDTNPASQVDCTHHDRAELFRPYAPRRYECAACGEPLVDTGDGVTTVADDVYLRAARAYVTSRYKYPINLDERPLDRDYADVLARSEGFRAAVDAVRGERDDEVTGLRAEVERITYTLHELLNGEKALGTRTWLNQECARLKAERDEARRQLADIRAFAETWISRAGGHIPHTSLVGDGLAEAGRAILRLLDGDTT